MNHMNFQNRLQHFGNTLSKSEQRIADYIIAHPVDASTLQSVELAKLIGTSNSTISRFCHKLDYRSYYEFQTFFSAENRQSTRNTSLDIASQLIQYYQQFLSASLEMINTIDLAKMIDTIDHAKKILICGIGSSGLTAIEFSNRLVRMGLNAKGITDSTEMLEQVNRFTQADLVIFFSTSGETPEIVRTCKAAKSIGVSTVVITKTNFTPLVALSDITLFVSDSVQIDDPCFSNTQFTFIYFIDILTYTLLLNTDYLTNYKKTLPDQL